MNGFSVRRLVPFGNLQRIPWAMLALAIAFPSRANLPDSPGAGGHLSGQRPST